MQDIHVYISRTQHRVGPSRSSVVVVVFNTYDSSSSQRFLLNPHGIPTKEMLLWSPFYRWEHWCPEKRNNLPKVTAEQMHGDSWVMRTNWWASLVFVGAREAGSRPWGGRPGQVVGAPTWRGMHALLAFVFSEPQPTPQIPLSQLLLLCKVFRKQEKSLES